MMQTLQLQPEAKHDDKSELQAAFQLFTQMSDQLETSYRKLEHRVEQLSTELAAANSEKLKQLAEKEKLADRLEALHAAMPAAVIWVDQSQTILSANQSAEEIFKENIVGQDWEELLVRQQFSFNGHELSSSDGSIYSYSQSALGAGQGQVVILTDVTLSRELQQSSHRQQRLAELGEITAGMAHQVRTPLSSALLSIEQLSHPSISCQLQQKSINRIRLNLRHLDHLVNDMLLFARDGKFENENVSVLKLMQNLNVYLKQKTFQNFECSIDKDLLDSESFSEDIIVAGSSDALLSVLISLVENASQLATESSHIFTSISVELDKNKVLIRVKDNGEGLTREQCENIFKPFYSTRKEGNGLGLAISQSIVRAHQGSLIAVSEQGSGTEMQIRLDLYQPNILLQSNTGINQFKQVV